MTKVMITGAAGFIGSHVARALLARGDEVLGVDSLTPYYDPELKRARLATLVGHPRFRWAETDLTHRDAFETVFRVFGPERVLHLAAQPGVRHSFENPSACVDANLIGFHNALEAARAFPVANFVYASSSSIYGTDEYGNPRSFYAVTKLANEMQAAVYARGYGVPTLGLRLFSVYGPWGRPDMAIWRFAESVLRGTALELYGDGTHYRDFTYIDDAVSGIVAALDAPAPGRVFDLGRGTTVTVRQMIATLGRVSNKLPRIVRHPAHPFDLEGVVARLDDAREHLGYAPRIDLEEGLRRFTTWLEEWLKIADASPSAKKTKPKTTGGTAAVSF